MIFEKFDKDTANFVNSVTTLGLELVEEEEGVDMCLAMERKEQRDNVNGAIKAYSSLGLSQNDVIDKVVENFGVTKEYVLELMGMKTA